MKYLVLVICLSITILSGCNRREPLLSERMFVNIMAEQTCYDAKNPSAVRQDRNQALLDNARDNGVRLMDFEEYKSEIEYAHHLYSKNKGVLGRIGERARQCMK